MTCPMASNNAALSTDMVGMLGNVARDEKLFGWHLTGDDAKQSQGSAKLEPDFCRCSFRAQMES